jgi:serine phosphatase RsbU (regulator of sigma subunit)
MARTQYYLKKQRWVWMIVLGLSPLAYFIGTRLALKYDPNANVGIALDRSSAIDAARRSLNSRGVDVNGWPSLCKIFTNDNLHFYYPLHPGADAEIAKQAAPEVSIGVVFQSLDKTESIEVMLDKTGAPIGYTRYISKLRDSMDSGELAARTLAETAFQSRLSRFGLSAKSPMTMRESASDGIVTRVYTSSWPLPSLEGLTLESKLTVQGGELIGDVVTTSFAQGYTRKYLYAREPLKIVSVVLYALVVATILIYGIYRFVQRVSQKEISFTRIAVLTLLYAAIMSALVLTSDIAIYDVSKNPDFPAPKEIILFSAVMSYIAVSLFLGLAYGAGEGDIRESYPGKLTSLDALITGRIFSKNVATAALRGVAFGGWTFLLMALMDLIWVGKPAAGEAFSGLEFWYSHIPALSPFCYWVMDVILITVIGLLLPLPFLRRRFKSPRVIIGLLVIFVWIAAAGPYMDFRPWIGTLAEAAIRAGAFLLVFYAFDLLTAMAMLAAPTFFSFTIAMTVQPAPMLRLDGYISLSIAGVAMATAIYLSMKGKYYREDEVRPVYAKHLAERLAMKAEVSAAREAQMRLMPDTLPQNSHFSIAAACLPAYEVGGDYYDLFELEPGKIGVLISEGAGRGLGSALSAAFAKGYLTPKILNNGSGDNSPTEIVRGLQDRLLSMLEVSDGLGIAYAVIDADDRTVRYARVGAHPIIAVSRGEKSDQLAPAAERKLSFISNHGAGREISVFEGLASLESGDSVVFYTDGVEKDWKNNGSSAETEFSKLLGAIHTRTGNLQNALTDALKGSSKRARKRGSDDDLTAVIIRLEPNAGDESDGRSPHR